MCQMCDEYEDELPHGLIEEAEKFARTHGSSGDSAAAKRSRRVDGVMIAATAPTGYSGTPLPQKLGLKDGQRVLFISLPKELKELRKSRNFVEMAEARLGDLHRRRSRL